MTFKVTMEYLSKTFPKIKGNLHLQHYESYFELEKKHDEFIFDRTKSLIPWLREWARIETRRAVEEDYKEESGRVVFTVPDKYHMDRVQARSRLSGSIPELYCIARFKKELHKLVLEAANFAKFPAFGKLHYQNKAFFKLVSMDKSFLTANWALPITRYAEWDSDRLTTALKNPGFRTEIHYVHFSIAIILLWYLGGRKLTYRAFQNLLKEQGYSLYEFTELGSFRKHVNRLGLKKRKKERQK